MTPKWHILLNHLVQLLERAGGGWNWGKIALNRHISGGKGTDSAIVASCKVKIQSLRLVAPIKKVQAEVIQSSKQNLVRCL
jgi:hypothetical protein